ncbi:hypothetical protein ACFL2H_02470 [Planctomycetota bacterium]
MIGLFITLMFVAALTNWIVRHDAFSNCVGGPTPIDFHATEVPAE